MCWYSSFEADRELARALAALAQSAYRKVPGKGPRLISLGHAAIAALGAMPGMDAVGQLALLKVKVKFIPAQKELEKALVAAAEREGMPRAEVDELAVPGYGMQEVGRRRETFGDYIAELVAEGQDVEVRWSKAADGKPLKSVPAAVKKDHADDVKELQGAVKDASKMLTAQRERIDGLFLARKRWPLDAWRARYLDHPLVGVIARRLIWHFETDGAAAQGIWLDGQLVDVRDQALGGMSERTTVELWHPIGHSIDEVTAWRRLARPPPDPATVQAGAPGGLRSDRRRARNAHLLQPVCRPHPSAAPIPCLVCGPWMAEHTSPDVRQQLSADLQGITPVERAHRVLGRGRRRWRWNCHHRVRLIPLPGHRPGPFLRDRGRDSTAHASGGGYTPEWNRVDAEPMPLDRIPPLVLSEILRDVDLFVGVASVGNDPAWADGGPNGRHVDYWNRYSFGDLSATGQTRKAVLERLVPRLKIASRCTFRDRFLVVRGDRRTYKIHLGSGNILMEPNDQYLCIVAKRGASEPAGGSGVFLPFEGDNTLSIILSKALLLADDAKISDPSIISQIKR